MTIRRVSQDKPEKWKYEKKLSRYVEGSTGKIVEAEIKWKCQTKLWNILEKIFIENGAPQTITNKGVIFIHFDRWFC